MPSGLPARVRRRPRTLLAAALLVGGLAVPAALADGPSGGDLVAQCYSQGSQSVDDNGYKFCRSVEAAVDSLAAACRTPLRSAPPPAYDPAASEKCAAFDGREVSEAKIRAYEASWVHRALSLQQAVTMSAPWWEVQLPHTHNSFNSSAYQIPTDGSMPSYYATLTNQDPNQVYSMTDQLRMDVRFIEIDVHWMPSPYGNAETHGYWPTMCHGDGEDPTGQGVYVHVGCTDDRPLQDGLAEVRRWLDAHPHEVVAIYLENQMYGADPVASATQAHDVAAGIIRSTLGNLVDQPPAGMPESTCAPMPYDRSPAQMLAAHKQVMLVGNCGPGSWNDWVFTRGPRWDESGNPTTYGEADCARDEAARQNHTSFRRWYEESPWLEAMTDATQKLTATTTAAMVRCGANIVGFDQLQPFDGRLQAFVWSWAQDEPAATGSCAYQGGDGRFHAGDCGGERHFACLDPAYGVHVTSATGSWRDGFDACATEFPGSSYGVPPNGYRNAQLAAAKPAGVTDVWLDYARVGADWVPHAPKPVPAVHHRHTRKSAVRR